MPEFMKSEVFWTAVGAVFTAIASLAILVAIHQLRFDAWLKAQELFTSKEFREARGVVFARLDEKKSEWQANDKEAAFEVCRRMDELAHLAPFMGWLPPLGRRAVLTAWGPPYAKAWHVLESFVSGERARSKWPKKWYAFEALGRKALTKYPDSVKAAAGNPPEATAAHTEKRS